MPGQTTAPSRLPSLRSGHGRADECVRPTLLRTTIATFETRVLPSSANLLIPEGDLATENCRDRRPVWESTPRLACASDLGTLSDSLQADLSSLQSHDENRPGTSGT